MGTWASPSTLERASSLAVLMKEPIRAENASSLIWNLIGDDDFWDTVDPVREFEPDADIRCLIASKLSSWVNSNPNFWKTPWEPEAITICTKLADEHYSWEKKKQFQKYYGARRIKWEVEKIEKERGLA